MKETFKPARIWCTKGEGEADIYMSLDGTRGYVSEVCVLCYFYTNWQLDVHTQGTPIAKGVATERLVQTIQQTPSGPVIIECTPPVKEVADDIDSPVIKEMGETISRALRGAAALLKSEEENE